MFIRAAALAGLLLVAACNAPPAATEPPKVASHPAANPEGVTFPFGRDEAISRFTHEIPALAGETPLDFAQEGDQCRVLDNDQLTFRTCAKAAGVTSIVVLSRSGARAQDLPAAIKAMALTIDPAAEAADISRIQGEVTEAFARSTWTRVCPTTRCFRADKSSTGWVLTADPI